MKLIRRRPFSSVDQIIIVEFCLLLSRNFHLATTETGDLLSVPVAFPIFRPPLATVQRQKSSADNIPLRFHSLPHTSTSTNLTASSDVEEISAPSDSFSSPEEEDASSQQQIELIPTKNSSANQISNNTALLGQRTFINAKTKEPMKLAKSDDGHESTSAASITASLSPLHFTSPNSHANARPSTKNVIHTPQFPVFTGMGMEIIESQEGNESGNNSMKDQERNKMHYQRTGEHLLGNNNSSLIAPFEIAHQKTVALATETTEHSIVHETTNKMPIPASTDLINRENGSRISGSTKTEKIDPTGESKLNGGSLRTEAQTRGPILSTTFGAVTADEVTEDLLAMLNKVSSNSVLSSTTPVLGSAESNDFHNIGLNKKDELDSGFERVTQLAVGGPDSNIPTTLPTSRPKEEILPRPTVRPPQLSTGIESTTTSSSARIFTRFPLLWTTESSTTNSQTKASSMIPTTGLPMPNNKVDAFGEQNGQQTSTDAPTVNWPDRVWPGRSRTTTEWPMSNHLEEEEDGGEKTTALAGSGKERAETTTAGTMSGMPSDEVQSQLPSGKKGNAKANMTEENPNDATPSKQSASKQSAKANLRMFLIAGIILALMVVILGGSVCAARYVKKSRQLHGKYRPAAYEMQTQQRYQPDFVQQIPMQQQQQQHQTSIFNGKEERLI